MSDYDEEKTFPGLYRGKVVQHLNAGRLKVFIPGLYPDDWENKPQYLPVCEQCTPLFAGNVDGNGMFSYPNIGTTILCMFANNDQNYPIAIGAILGGKPASSQYNEARPNVTSETIKTGDDAFVHKINSKYTSIKIWESGRLEITVNGNEAGSTYAKIWMDGKGTIDIDASQQISIHAPCVTIDADSSMAITTPTLTTINGISNTTIAPSINLDAKSSGAKAGTILIKGARHSQTYN